MPGRADQTSYLPYQPERQEQVLQQYSLLFKHDYLRGVRRVFPQDSLEQPRKKVCGLGCISRLENTGLFCDARTVQESQIEQVLVTVINKTLCRKDDFLATLRNNIEAVLCHSNKQTLACLDKRLLELQAELLKLASSKA